MSAHDYRVKFDRDYSEAERVLFSAYSGQRARLKPRECDSGEECWVSHGPPCYRTNGWNGYCAGCRGKVLASR